MNGWKGGKKMSNLSESKPMTKPRLYGDANSKGEISMTIELQEPYIKQPKKTAILMNIKPNHISEYGC